MEALPKLYLFSGFCERTDAPINALSDVSFRVSEQQAGVLYVLNLRGGFRADVPELELADAFR